MRIRRPLGLFLIASSTALVLVAACSDDESTSSSSPSGSDASISLDGSNDGGDRDGSSNPGDGSVISDAGADVDPYADADKNCANYALTPAFAPATVKVVNQTGAPIYLGMPSPKCEPYFPFTFTDQNDASIPMVELGDNDCKELQTECSSVPCPVNVVTKIANNGSYDTGWPGTVFATKWMPPSCYADASCVKGPCLQQVAAPSGVIRAVGYATPTCDGGTCDCTPGAGGNCTVFGGVGVTGATHSGEVTYTPGASLVTVTIQ